MKRLALLAAIGIIGTPALLPRVSADEKKPSEETTTSKTLSSRDTDRANLNVWVGNIKVYADSPDDVKIKAVRHAEGGTAEERHRWLTETSVQIESQGGVISLKDIVPESLRKSQEHRNGRNSLNVYLKLEVHLPARLALDLAELAGNILIEGAAGGINVDTTAGNLTLKGLRCANKKINIHHSAGNIEMDGEAGDLTLENGAGQLTASSLRCTGREVDLHIGAGQVEFDALSLPSERLKVEVGTGQIHLTLPANAQARISASTGIGGIDSGLSLTSRKRSGSRMGGSLSGDLNGGGTLLSAHTGVGQVHLETR